MQISASNARGTVATITKSAGQYRNKM